MNVEKTTKRDEQEHQERSGNQQPLPNVLVLLVIAAASSFVCVYVYHVAVRLHRLEQHVEVMSHQCPSSVRSPATSMSTADLRRRTSSASTAPSTMDETDWTVDTEKVYNNIDEGQNSHDEYPYDYYDYVAESGSGLPDDEEDAEESSSSGDDGSHESHGKFQFNKFIPSSNYQDLYKRNILRPT